MSDPMMDDGPEPMKPVVKLAIVAGVVVVAGLLGFGAYRSLSKATLIGMIHDLDSPDITARQEARKKLKDKSAKTPLVASTMLEYLAEGGDADIERREVVTSMLISFSDDNTIVVLAETLADPESDPYVRSVAIKALSEMRDTRSAEALVGLFGHETEAEVAHEAVISLGPIAIPTLAKALENKNVLVRQRAAAVMGRLGDPKAIEPLGGALDDDDAVVRDNAVKALAAIGGEEVIPLIAKALSDQDVQVRKDAVNALERTPDPRILDACIAALTDKDAHVRSRAAKILGKLGDPKAVEPLLKSLGDKDSDALWNMVDTLGILGDRSAVDPLIELLDHKNENVRRAAISALGNLGDPRAVEPILNGKDSDTVTAVVAYGKLKDNRALEKLLEILLGDIGLKDYVTNALIRIDDETTLELVTLAFEDPERCTFTEEIKQNILTTLTEKKIKAVTKE
jgi:HEAT repeat protein